MMHTFRFLLVATFFMHVMPVLAVEPDEILTDATLEARARELSTELRCLVCQNQSIDDSDAPLAKDLRVLIRQRLSAGDSDNQVVDFVVARYGEFVLLRPRFAPHTWALWLGAPLILLLGIILIVVSFRRRRLEQGSGMSAPLTAQEEKSLERILDEG